MRVWTILLIILLIGPGARAHENSVSFLNLKPSGSQVAGEWHVAIKDLDLLFGLDANQDRHITWGEGKARVGEIDRHLAGGLAFRTGSRSTEPVFQERLVDERSGIGYLVLRFGLSEMPEALDYRF